MEFWRRSVLPRLLLVPLCLLATGTTACRDRPEPPTHLVDGSPAATPSVELTGVDGLTVATRLEVTAADQLAERSKAATCLELFRGYAIAGYVVARVGVSGESVTFRSASAGGGGLHGCDGAGAVGRQGDHRWCGRAYGRLENGRLGDPRLDLACISAAGDPAAFAWIEPAPAAAFVAVRQPGFVEVYEVAAGLPVRVTTMGSVAVEESSASFAISEHDRDGVRLRAYTVRARVSG